jgi:hypothetical protein
MQAKDIGAVVRSVVAHRSQLVSAVVLGWSIDYTVTLGVIHHTGPQLFGVLTAAVSAGAAIANLRLLRSSSGQPVLTGAVVALWTLVAAGGIGGTIAHLSGPFAGRPLVESGDALSVAPLVFTLLGLVGAAALVLGQRALVRAGLSSQEGGAG